MMPRPAGAKPQLDRGEGPACPITEIVGASSSACAGLVAGHGLAEAAIWFAPVDGFLAQVWEAQPRPTRSSLVPLHDCAFFGALLLFSWVSPRGIYQRFLSSLHFTPRQAGPGLLATISEFHTSDGH